MSRRPGQSSENIVIPLEDLEAFGRRVLAARGVPVEEAEYIARIAATAEAMGITTHGLVQLTSLDRAIGKDVDPARPPRVARDTGCTALIDGEGVIGQVAMHRAVRLGSAKAKEHGMAFIAVGNTSWIAAIGVYLIELAEAGLLAQAWCQSSQCQDCAPSGGLDARVSTNPIALAIPVKGGDPVLADFSTAAVSMGRTSRLAAAGRRAAHPYFMDSAGNATDDPTVMVDANGQRRDGSILFWGGLSEGHKGYAMSLWCEAMAALAGGSTNNPDAPSRQSFSLMVIDPEAFAGGNHFGRQMEHLAAWLKSSRPHPAFDGVRLPGGRGFAALRQARNDGVILSRKLAAQLDAMAQRANCPGLGMGGD